MASPDRQWFTPFARAGYFSRGVVYLVIGSLAALAAFSGGKKTNSKGALTELLQQPFGTVIIWLMIVGLIGYVLWRLIQSLFDTDDHGWSPKGIAVRGGLLASAFTYTTLTIYALDMMGIVSSGGDGNGPSVSDMIGGFIGKNYVSLGLSLVFLGVAIAHWYKAATRKYADHFIAGDDVMPYIHVVSIVGLTARGLVFAVISMLLFYRFLNAGTSSKETPGIKDVLNFVHDLPAGNVLLFALSAGIILFAGYSFAQFYWRRINVQDA